MNPVGTLHEGRGPQVHGPYPITKSAHSRVPALPAAICFLGWPWVHQTACPPNSSPPKGTSKTMFTLALSSFQTSRPRKGIAIPTRREVPKCPLPILQFDITVPGPVILVSPACLCLSWVVAAPRCPSP